MRIKIIKAQKPTYWYADKIGMKYKVLTHASNIGVRVFRFISLFNRAGYFVFHGDYEILNDSSETK
jgi:hypothetical protein